MGPFMITTMSNSSGKKRMGRPPKDPDIAPGSRSGKAIFARLTEEVATGLTAFVEHYNASNRLRTEKSAHIEKAVIEYLERNGFWPVPSP
jgi:hypothetical protein